jgi:formylglycine-generating enzyme required for sulfatase activity
MGKLVSVEKMKTTPRKRHRQKLSAFSNLLALGLALISLVVVLGLWMNRSASSPGKTGFEATAPVSVVFTSTSPTTTITPTPSATPTATSTPVPTATPYPNALRDNKNVEMVLIPAGSFVMGSDVGESDEKPAHTVSLDAYYIDKYEITNEQYELCVQLNVCRRPFGYGSYQRLSYFSDPLFANYPVINVTSEMARVFCEDWRGARLPTEAEWEKAAGGPDNSIFPWGEEISCQYANYRDKACLRVRDTSPVTSFASGVSVYGVYNMAGNVWEWVTDWYSPAFYLNSPLVNPTGPERPVVGIYYIKRGGSFQDEAHKLRSTNREKIDPTNSGSNLGFRCVRPIVEMAP